MLSANRRQVSQQPWSPLIYSQGSARNSHIIVTEKRYIGNLNAGGAEEEDHMEHGRKIHTIFEGSFGPKKEIPFIRLTEEIAMCGKRRSSIYAAIKHGQFPKPIKLPGGASAWMRSEVLQWMQARINARNAGIQGRIANPSTTSPVGKDSSTDTLNASCCHVY